MRSSFMHSIFGSIADAGRDLLDLASTKDPVDRFQSLCQDLLSQKGEASGMALAREIITVYGQLDEAGRETFFQFLYEGLGPDKEAIARAAETYQADPSDKNYLALSAVVESPRQEFIRRINMAPGGTAAVVNMRADLLNLVKKQGHLKTVDADFRHLLSSWFNRGFLVLHRIDWSTPAAVLEKLIEYEAVHEIQGWDDLRRRLDKDRRCFAFFHPALADEPLIFVEVALVKGISDAVQPLLDLKGERGDPEKADTAIFYSINNCQVGLKGITLGNFLIKQVVRELVTELPNLKQFSTLSPVPGFRRWLEKEIKQPTLTEVLPEKLARLSGLGNDWLSDEKLVSTLKDPLMKYCALYLLEAKRGLHPIDPVARFHLGNGAKLERMNWLADTADSGLKNSYGIMVNYLYEPKLIEKNHERYANEGEIAVSSTVSGLIK